MTRDDDDRLIYATRLWSDCSFLAPFQSRSVSQVENKVQGDVCTCPRDLNCVRSTMPAGFLVEEDEDDPMNRWLTADLGENGQIRTVCLQVERELGLGLHPSPSPRSCWAAAPGTPVLKTYVR